jgi:hypothetical protein
MIYEKKHGTSPVLASTVVVCIGRNNCISEGYYGHLNDGEKYILRDELLEMMEPDEPIQPRTKAEILDFVINGNISWDVIGHPSEGNAVVEFYDDRTTLIISSYPYEDSDSVLEGIEFIMDMKEMLD